MAITFGLRFNLSLTIVAMINHTHHDQLLERLEHNEKTENMYLNDSQCFHPNEKSKSIAEMVSMVFIVSVLNGKGFNMLESYT